VAPLALEVPMGLVTNITKTVNIPGEDANVVIRKLSHVQLKLAAKARQSEGVGFMRELGAELMKALREERPDDVKKLQDAQEADIHNYDRSSLLRYGVLTWDYEVPPIAPEPMKEGERRGVDGLDELDEPTARFLGEEIFAFSRPETKSEAKNAS
jgi:hypothetical protein